MPSRGGLDLLLGDDSEALIAPGDAARAVDAARHLFWEKGYGSTSVADVLHAAQVNSGSLYHFFPAKQDLLLLSNLIYNSFGADGVAGNNVMHVAVSKLRRLLAEAEGLDEVFNPKLRAL